MIKEKVNPHNFNNDILGGIKAAIERGEEIKDAMMTFYNAGYSKREIEEAARNYVMEKRARESGGIETKKIPDKLKKQGQEQEKGKKLTKGDKQKEILTQKLNPSDSVGSAGQSPNKQEKSRPAAGTNLKKAGFSNQVTSKYGEKPILKKKMFEPITIVLVLLLFLLVIILGAVFLFKTELVEFFNKLFG